MGSSSGTPHQTHRRPLLVALASAAAVTGVGAAARTGFLSRGGDEAAGPADGVLQLSAGAMGVEALELALDDGVLHEVAPGQWRSGPLATTTHSMIAFVWRRGAKEPRIETSSRIGGVWQPWQRMPHTHDAPDADSGEGTGLVGTEVVWTGPADGIRLRVRHSRPRGLALVLLHPTALAGDRRVAAAGKTAPDARVLARADGTVPAPKILTRRDWGANERLRDGAPRYNTTIQQVHVHHTVNSNTYRLDETPALLRGIYAYHTQSLGWSDIGYNFLVDRFGRIWEGRAGGVARPVRGAHTLGFNATSTGISVIGNFDAAAPSPAIKGAIARIAAWKLGMYGRDPLGRTTVASEGSDKYRSGARVMLPVIDGHRDTNDTACPGKNLYAALPAIRRRTKAVMDQAAAPAAAAITTPFTVTGTPVDGEQLTVRPGAWTPATAVPTYTWMRDGVAVTGTTTAAYLLTAADVGAAITVRVDIAPTGVQPATQTLAFPAPVKARPVLVVRAVGRPHRAVVRVVATAAGLDGPVTGTVRMSIAGHSQTVALVDGRARVVFRLLKAGTYAAAVSYPGSTTTAPGSGTAMATVT